jgi:hypothetical protein
MLRLGRKAMSKGETCRGLIVVVALGVIVLCLAHAPAVAEEQWSTYSNPRYGATADYPTDLFTVQDPPPENGDGQTLHTADGRAELTIYGTNNIDGESPDIYVSRHVSLADVSYKKVGEDFYAVSGKRGATIYYERCNFPNLDVLVCFYISYPAAEKAKWDAIVTRIGQSLRFALTGLQ